MLEVFQQLSRLLLMLLSNNQRFSPTLIVVETPSLMFLLGVHQLELA